MRQISAGALHILLAVAVLFSSTGFVVDKHFCGGRLKNTAIFHRAKGCRQAEHADCADGGHCMAQKSRAKKGCCHNTVEYHKLSQDQKTADTYTFSLKLPVSFAAILPACIVFSSIPEAPVSPFLRYKPPVRYCKDVHALLQVFRL